MCVIAFKFDVQQVVKYHMGVAINGHRQAFVQGVIVAREYYQSPCTKEIVYWVKWLDDDGVPAAKPDRLQEWEIQPVEETR